MPNLNRDYSTQVLNLNYTTKGYICRYCGNQILSIDDCEVDHIIPFDKGGPTELENAQLLHKWCNRSKGNKTEPELDFEDDSTEEDSDSN